MMRRWQFLRQRRLNFRSTLIGLSFLGQRVVSSAIQVVMVPLLIGNLGKEGYGIFVLLQSLWNWASVSDLGVAGALQVEMARRRAEGESTNALIFTACLGAVVLALAMIPLSALLGYWLGPILLHPFDSASIAQKRLYTAFTLWVSASTGCAVVSYRVWVAEQKGHIPNLAVCCGFILAVGAVWGIFRLGFHDRLLGAIAAYWLPSMLIASGFLIYQLVRTATAQRQACWHALWPLAARARWLLLASVIGMCASQLDTLVLSRVGSIETLIEYTFAQKILMAVYFSFNALLLAHTPECSEAIFRRDWLVVSRVLKRLFAFATLIAAAIMPLLLIFGAKITLLLSPGSPVIVPNSLWLAGIAAFMARVWIDSFAAVLTNSNLVKNYLIITPFQAVISLALQIWLGESFGGIGIFLGCALGQLLTSGWYLPFILMRHKNRSALVMRQPIGVTH